MMVIDVLRPVLCTWYAKWAERPLKVIITILILLLLFYYLRLSEFTIIVPVVKTEHNTFWGVLLHNYLRSDQTSY